MPNFSGNGRVANLHNYFYIQGARMSTEQEKIVGDQTSDLQDDEAIEDAFVQMEIIYKSRCVQSPLGKTNVTVREIEKKE